MEAIKVEGKIRVLEDVLEKKQQESTMAIEMWSLRFSELSSAMNELKVEYEALSKEKQTVETTAREVSEMMENERALNESLSMQIRAMDKELLSARAMLVTVSEEGERAVVALQGEIGVKAESISVREARIITLEKLADDLRSEVDSVRLAAEQSVEASEGKKNVILCACPSIVCYASNSPPSDSPTSRTRINFGI